MRISRKMSPTSLVLVPQDCKFESSICISATDGAVSKTVKFQVRRQQEDNRQIQIELS